jgi:hypothetical protein
MPETPPPTPPADSVPPGDDAGPPAPRRLTIHEGVFRFLFVSPAYFTAAFERDGFELTVVFRSFDRRSGSRMAFDGPYARSTFMLSFEVPVPDKKLAVVIPQYHHVGEEVSALIGAFYGKFVINAGQMQSGNRLTVPNMWDGPCHTHEHPAFNQQPRKPDGPDLQLTHVAKLLEVYFYNQVEYEALDRVLRAAEFYRMALENFHERPEMAYTLLLSALEAIIDLKTYTDDDKYDPALQEQLAQIAAQCKDGAKIVAALKGRLYQIRRRVAKLVDAYIPDTYFQQREAREDFASIKSREDLRVRVLAAYDLRSKLLHTGNRTGISHLSLSSMGEEFVLGTPVLPDPDLVKLLVKCLTLAGLERVTSTVLRSVIHQHLLAPAV